MPWHCRGKCFFSFRPGNYFADGFWAEIRTLFHILLKCWIVDLQVYSYFYPLYNFSCVLEQLQHTSSLQEFSKKGSQLFDYLTRYVIKGIPKQIPSIRRLNSEFDLNFTYNNLIIAYQPAAEGKVSLIPKQKAQLFSIQNRFMQRENLLPMHQK